jgi:uncharacterized protein (TIGR02996 family)
MSLPSLTRDQLVRAVIADPDSDAPRKAFADWGVANGDPQGELTRLQLADRAERQKRGRSGEHRQAANALIEQHGDVWARDVLSIASDPRFHRGFVEAVTLDAPTFLSRAPELYTRAPIRAVTFVDAGGHIDVIAASPHLARLVALNFYNPSRTSPIGDDGLRKLVASPHVRKLAVLDLGSNNITRAGLEALCAARLPKLAYVRLHGNPVDSPVEEFSEDPSSGIIITNSVTDTPFGRKLEAKYGEQAWLHAPSLVRVFPPSVGDV